MILLISDQLSAWFNVSFSSVILRHPYGSRSPKPKELTETFTFLVLNRLKCVVWLGRVRSFGTDSFEGLPLLVYNNTKQNTVRQSCYGPCGGQNTVSVLVFWLPSLVFVLWGRSRGAGAKPNPPPIQFTFNGHLILTRWRRTLTTSSFQKNGQKGRKGMETYFKVGIQLMFINVYIIF